MIFGTCLAASITTPRRRSHPEVVEAVARAFPILRQRVQAFTRAASAKAALDEARGARRHASSAPSPAEVVFTGSGTRSDNRPPRQRRKRLPPADATPRNHHGHRARGGPLNTARHLVKRGFEADRPPVTADGVVTRRACAPRSAPMWRSSRSCTRTADRHDPAGRRARRGSRTSTRADAYRRRQVSARSRSMSAGLGSIVGPLGAQVLRPQGYCGCVVDAAGARLAPLLTGGRHERNRRAGTENVPDSSALASRPGWPPGPGCGGRVGLPRCGTD